MTSTNPTPEAKPVGMDDTIDLLELFTLFVVEWRIFFVAFLIAFVVGLGLIYSITPLYEASASLLPQNREDSNNLASFFSGRSPSDIFIGLLSSRSVADEVVARVGLLDLYHVKSQEDARAILAGRTVAAIGKDTLVNIKVRDADADAAMRITNAYLEALEDQRDKMLQREAEVHNRFFEQQLRHEADALNAAEVDLRNLQERTGLVQPEAQTNVGINAIAQLTTQITNLKVQLSALLLGESDQAPQVKALRAQIAQLEAQQSAMESASGRAGAGAAAAAKQMPQLNLEYTRKLREVKFHEALLTSISNQYEAARLSDGYTGAPFVVIDRAVAPEHKAWPPRRNLGVLAFGLSIVFAIGIVALILIWRRLQSQPQHREQLATIRSSFRFIR